MRNCVICKKEFQENKERRLTCSKKCARSWAYDGNKRKKLRIKNTN
jgi:predicted nucleic acid-binding Zn ribbon protein|tara:strand:+ start:3253 stop:3390 length:138 start_codon:yes stop_codon:yes gene_type:complete